MRVLTILLLKQTSLFIEMMKLLRSFPEKRLYNSSEIPMTEAGIAPKINGDLYITLEI